MSQKIITVDYAVESDPSVRHSTLEYLNANPDVTVILRCHPDLFQKVSYKINEDCRRRLHFQSIPRQERGDNHCYCCKQDTATRSGADYCDSCTVEMAKVMTGPVWLYFVD